jgi:hypothetical protein
MAMGGYPAWVFDPEKSMSSKYIIPALLLLACTDPIIKAPGPEDTSGTDDSASPDTSIDDTSSVDTSDSADSADSGDTATPPDSDGDGVPDEQDDCPDDPLGWTDADGDGECEDDTDGDGITNEEEATWGEDCSTSDPFTADSDQDGVLDGLDPYPLDPFAEYILFPNDEGTIDVSLSSRDGLFEESEQIGDLYGGTKNTDYRYISFLISDFNRDGATDFIALGDADPADTGNDYDVWWFYRTDSKFEFSQRLLGTWNDNPLDIIGDLDDDEWVDLVALEFIDDSSGYVESALLRSFVNQDFMETADCFATDDPTNPDECAFVQFVGTDLTSWMVGMWGLGASRDMVDVDGDGNRDIALFTYAGGGDDSARVTLARGNGDGSFIEPTTNLFEHNDGVCGSSPANVVVFGDFDSDEIGDMILGLDDDGDAGSAWFYPGQLSGSTYSTDYSSCFESFDISPSYESGSEHPGFSKAVRVFDFDFDGVLDIMIGYHYNEPWAPPSKTTLLWGGGDGTFDASGAVLVRDFPSLSYGLQFAVPHRVCPGFPKSGTE